MSVTNLHPLKTIPSTHEPPSSIALACVNEVESFQIDLLATPPDDGLLVGANLNKLLTSEVIPWRRFGSRLVYVTGKGTADSGEPPGGITHVNYVAANSELIQQHINKHLTDENLKIARELCPNEFSCRNFRINLFSPAFLIGLMFIGTTMTAFPTMWFLGLLVIVLISNATTTIFRFVSLVSWQREIDLPVWVRKTKSSDQMPEASLKVSILVPLFKEDAVLQPLISTLENLDYPKNLLEVKFLLEEVDDLTATSLSNLKLPDFIECVTVPKDWLQTKPKAMNYALPKCSGDIIGIYDAEDRPDRDQILKVVNHFMAAPANVACVQGFLDFYNSRANWLSRCFTIEYATWFRVILKGVQNFGLPIPLGGTTVFFRRDILTKIGGWDAHNVTEDADLGMRLARFGYRCEMVNTTTWEEANNIPLAWVRQRSRWLKGFAMTWATHMREPLRLLQDLGLAGFVSFQTILLGGLTAFLAIPIFWLLWLANFWAPIFPKDLIPQALWWTLAVVMISGQIVMLIAILRATMHKHLRHLIPYILVLPLYWPLGMFAAYKAIAELFYAPFYWDKTYHGRDDEDQP